MKCWSPPGKRCGLCPRTLRQPGTLCNRPPLPPSNAGLALEADHPALQHIYNTCWSVLALHWNHKPQPYLFFYSGQPLSPTLWENYKSSNGSYNSKPLEAAHGKTYIELSQSITYKIIVRISTWRRRHLGCYARRCYPSNLRHPPHLPDPVKKADSISAPSSLMTPLPGPYRDLDHSRELCPSSSAKLVLPSPSTGTLDQICT